MSTPLSQLDPLDGGATNRAGLARQTIDAVTILVASSYAVGTPIIAQSTIAQRASSLANSLSQCLANAGVQAAAIGQGQRVSGPAGIDSRSKQGLIGIDVANSRQYPLI